MSEVLTWWVGNHFSLGGGHNLIHTVNFFVKVRAGNWEEAIAELNTATRFLESGAQIYSSATRSRSQDVGF